MFHVEHTFATPGGFVTHRIVTNPELPPGCCFLSLTSDGPFIDTGKDIEDLADIGRVYLAVSTISDYAQALGFVPPEAARRGLKRIEDLEAVVAELTQLNAGLQAANEALIAGGYQAALPVDESVYVPAASVEDVLAWVSAPDHLTEALNRAHAAWNAEMLEASPREALLVELRQFIEPKETADAPVPR